MYMCAKAIMLIPSRPEFIDTATYIIRMLIFLRDFYAMPTTLTCNMSWVLSVGCNLDCL